MSVLWAIIPSLLDGNAYLSMRKVAKSKITKKTIFRKTTYQIIIAKETIRRRVIKVKSSTEAAKR